MISIIIPVYNVELFIERCLSSVVNQSQTPFEVLLIDDGSLDGSSRICEFYADKYEFIKYFKKENGGLSDARNYGIEKATGDYLLFLDSDDYIEIDTNKKITELVKNNNKDIDIFVGNANRYEEGNCEKINNLFQDNVKRNGIEYLFESLKRDNLLVPTWLHIYKREFILINNLFFKKGIYHEDEEHTPRALLKAKTVLPTKITHYNYMIRENSIMTSSNKLQKRFLDLKEIHTNITKEIEILNNKTILEEYENHWLSIYFEYFYLLKNNKQEYYLYINEVKALKPFRKNKIKKKIFILSPNLFFRIIDLKRREI